MNKVKAGIDKEVVIKKKGAKLIWDCSKGHYLDKNEFRGGISKEYGGVVEFADNCKDNDKYRSNKEFAKKYEKWFKEGVEKMDKYKKKNPKKYAEIMSKILD